jgi:hypothetical protein
VVPLTAGVSEDAPLPPVRQRRSPSTRAALSVQRAVALAALFDVLANDTRLRLLHALVHVDELCVSELGGSARQPAHMRER